MLKLAGIEPDGFVAPAYAYTAALRQALSLKFSWWAGLLRVHRAQPGLAASARGASGPRAWSFAATGPLSRVFSPSLVRAGSLLPMSTLRLDLHPADLQHPRHMMALEWVLAGPGSRRTAITYRELAGVRRTRRRPVVSPWRR